MSIRDYKPPRSGAYSHYSRTPKLPVGHEREAVPNKLKDSKTWKWLFWVLVIIGALIINVIVTLIIMSSFQPDEKTSEVQNSPAATPRGTVQAPSPPPEKVVITGEGEVGDSGYQFPTDSVTQTVETDGVVLPENPVAYVLQAASFRTRAKAVQEQQRLRRGGFKLHISQSTINGTVYYRVQSSVMSDPVMVEAAMNSLSRYGVKALKKGISFSKLTPQQQQRLRPSVKTSSATVPKAAGREPRQTCNNANGIRLGDYRQDNKVVLINILNGAGLKNHTTCEKPENRELVVIYVRPNKAQSEEDLKRKLASLGFTLEESH